MSGQHGYTYWGGVDDAEDGKRNESESKHEDSDDPSKKIITALDRIVAVCDDVRKAAETLEPKVHDAFAVANRTEDAELKDFIRDVAGLIALIKLHL